MSTLTKTTNSSPATASAAAQPRTLTYQKPAVQLFQDAEGYVLEAELPGVNKSGLEITVEDGQLTILGHRPPMSEAEANYRVWHQERGSGNFKRVFDLDPTIDPASITASLEQGLLTVRLRKAAAHQPRKIAVS